MLALPSCEGFVVANTMAVAEQANAVRQAKYNELEALRLNAGLNYEQYYREMRLYDPEWYRVTTRNSVQEELRKRGLESGHGVNKRTIPYNDRRFPADLRKTIDGMPKEDTVWNPDQLLYRARRLIARTSEEQILEELRAKNPRWYERLDESGWLKRAGHARAE